MQLPAGMLSGCKCLHLLRIHDNKVTLEQLRDEPGYEAYDARRRARYSKVIEGSAMFDGFDEGASSTLFDHFAS